MLNTFRRTGRYQHGFSFFAQVSGIREVEVLADGIEPTGPGIAVEKVALTPAQVAGAVRAAVAPAAAPQITTEAPAAAVMRELGGYLHRRAARAPARPSSPARSAMAAAPAAGMPSITLT